MPVALITGGTRGIGFGIAKALAAAKFDLVINGIRREGEVTSELKLLRDMGISTTYVPGDIGKESDRAKIYDHALQSCGAIDVLINNAGVAPPARKDILELEESDYDPVMDVNLKGTLFLTIQVAKKMIETPSNRHCIIFISSVSAEMVSLNRAAYCISKAGVSMVSKLMAVRLGATGIPVYEIRPGIVETDMTAAVHEKYDKLIEGGIVPEQRWGKPDDVGRVVRALAQGELPYSTGTVFHVDGGLTISRL